MRELEQHLKDSKKVELNIKKQQEIEYVLQGTIKPKRGHKVWEINEETGEIKEAQYKQDTLVYHFNFKHHPYYPEKLIVKSDCVYIPALNADNAKRKYLSHKEQEFYYTKPSAFDINDITI